MWYILAVAIAIALIIVLIVLLIQRYIYKLKVYLFDSTWKSFDDCIQQGFRASSLGHLLEVLYKRGVLEVKLHEHVYDCIDCKYLIHTMVMLQTLDPNIDNGEIEFENFEEKDIPYEYFAGNMFSEKTAKMFRFRLKKKPHRRRWGKVSDTFGFQVPGTLKPVSVS